MTDDLRTAACPDAEQLAEYVEGLLTAKDRARVEEHLADCEICREVVANVVRVREVPAKVVPFWRRPKMLGGALAVAASLVVVARLQPEWNPFRQPTPYEELVAAVGTNRTVEARLAGGFQYGPLRTTTRSGSAGQPEDYALLAAVTRILARADHSPTSEALETLGLAHLVGGDLDEAIQALETAANGPDEASARVRASVNLSAAYLARAASRPRPGDASAARSAAERALEIDSRSAEASFNLALALESTGSRDAALAAWKRYLELDSSGGWSDEARKRLDAPR